MRLYIIGNGFDLHHRLRSSYSDYRDYLFLQRPDLARNYELSEYLCAAELPIDCRWSDLEKALRINYEEAFDRIVNDHYPNMNSEKTPGWNDINIEIDNQFGFIENFTKYEFFKWISDVNRAVCGTYPSKKIFVDRDARYITFNYTDTLEAVYGVPLNNILHIHGTVNDPNSIQFGTPENNPGDISGCLQKKYSCDEFYNVVFNPAIESMRMCAGNAYKNLVSNMGILSDFIIKSGQISEVIIMGHSILGIDAPYYERVVVPLCQNAVWTFYVYSHSPEKEDDARLFINGYGIRNARIEYW